MLLPPEEAEHFLEAYQAALHRIAGSRCKGNNEYAAARRALYEGKHRKNPPTDDPSLLAALKTAIYGDFIIGRHLAQHTEMIGPKEKVYWVKGLTTEYKDIMPPWVWVKTAVMQFKGHWITDGLIESTNLLIGRNMIRNFTETIREAKAKAQAKQKAETKKTKAVKSDVPHPKANKARENRITMEIVVDAYNEQERAIGWYCYMEEKLQFPFTAKCINVRTISPLEQGDEVEVKGMAPSSECEHEMFVEMRWGKRNLAVPLSQLEVIEADKQTKEAVADWHYWISRGYRL